MTKNINTYPFEHVIDSIKDATLGSLSIVVSSGALFVPRHTRIPYRCQKEEYACTTQRHEKIICYQHAIKTPMTDFLSPFWPLDHFDHYVAVRNATLDFFGEKNIHLGGSVKNIYKQYIRGILNTHLWLWSRNKRLELFFGLNRYTEMVRGKKECFRASGCVRYLVYCNS